MLLNLSIAVGAAPTAELSGIGRFDVTVGDLTPEARNCGLSETGLIGLVDSCLDAAGLPAHDTAAAEFISLRVAVMQVFAGPRLPTGYAYRVDFDFCQPASLLNHPLTLGFVTSWHDGCLGTTGNSPARLRQAIVRTITNYTGRFIADFQAANAP